MGPGRAMRTEAEVRRIRDHLLALVTARPDDAYNRSGVHWLTWALGEDNGGGNGDEGEAGGE